MISRNKAEARSRHLLRAAQNHPHFMLSGETPLLLFPLIQDFRSVTDVASDTVKMKRAPHNVVETLLLPHPMDQSRSAVPALDSKAEERSSLHLNAQKIITAKDFF